MMMYIITPDPYKVPLDANAIRFTQKKELIKKLIDEQAMKFPNEEIQVFTLTRKVIPKVTIKLVEYIVNEQGEVLPA